MCPVNEQTLLAVLLVSSVQEKALGDDPTFQRAQCTVFLIVNSEDEEERVGGGFGSEMPVPRHMWHADSTREVQLTL